MPVVPRYEPNVSLAPSFRQNLTTQASAEDAGAAIARGMGAVGQGLGQVANAALAVQEMDDDARLKEADARAAARLRELQYGEGGYLTLEGKAAVEARAAYEAQAAKVFEEEGAGFTGRAGAKWKDMSMARTNQILDTAIVHQANERKKWFGEASASRVDTFAEDALAGYQNPKTVTRNIAAGIMEIRQQGALQGWDADTLRNRETEFASGVHKNIALRLAQTDPFAAKEYLEKNRDMMTGPHQTDLEGVVAPLIIEEEAKRKTDEILGLSRPIAGRTLGETGPSNARAVLTSRAVGGATRSDAIDNLDANFATNLAAMIEDAPPGIREGLGIGSGYRSTERQAELFAASDGSGRMVARPGHSSHEFGLAADLTWNGQRLDKAPKEVRDWVHQNAAAYGLNFRMSWEPWHVEPIGAREAISAAGPGLGVRTTMPSASQTAAALDAIDNPTLRAATAERLRAISALREQEAKAQREAMVTNVFGMIDSGMSPDSIPAETRAALGRTEMAGLWEYYEKRVRGALATDERTLYDLQTQYAQDPAAFSQIDLWQYRSALSDADWKQVTGWRQTALTDQAKAKDEGMTITSAFSQAKTQLEAVGITQTGLEGSERQAAAAREAQFQMALAREMEAFRQSTQKAPNQLEIQQMINKLLLPIVIERPRGGTGLLDTVIGPARTEGMFRFEVPQLGAAGDGGTARIFQDYDAIPPNDRIQLEIQLEGALGRKPSEEEVESAYAAYLNSIYGTGQ